MGRQWTLKAPEIHDSNWEALQEVSYYKHVLSIIYRIKR